MKPYDGVLLKAAEGVTLDVLALSALRVATELNMYPSTIEFEHNGRVYQWEIVQTAKSLKEVGPLKLER